jgi:hypothetical protein
MHHVYLQRNDADFRWDDGTEEPLEGDETADLDDGSPS